MATTLQQASTSQSTDLDSSQWAPDQETALLRSIITNKPVGMHKHFRMIAISNDLNQHSIATSTAQIWAKLNQLYDLPGLDEREDADITNLGDDEGAYWRDFELPGADFEALMWQRRLNPDDSHGSGSESPEAESAREQSEVAETDEARSSPVPSATGRGGRRGMARKSGRLTRLAQSEMEVDMATPGSTKAESVVPEDEDKVMEDAADEDDGANDDDADSSEEEEHEEEEKRGTTTRRGRGAPKRGRGGTGARRGRRRG
ncbi:Chromatin modification-related protein EAF7 [Cyphellophora attinorum]|uniref:Chromatin modification-related protein EAF7 n=1 Tax=Cyphellophora attinorum TaxID=1664694 RepID=A0A0N0NKA6_9EURO|nr:Chromatin modification-related protein EAF7 [Phialophora attinorum]KPI37921.1 Chromatin modification-related protein EAF7 [Phialophora attinorum]